MSGQDLDAAGPEPRGRIGIARWIADLTLGARFAVTGGRESWARTILTAVGVGLGVALLLAAASVPTALSASNERDDARSVSILENPEPGPDTVQLGKANTTFHDAYIEGLVMSPDGPGAPEPPGISRIPRAGEMWVSPALGRLLDSDDGKLLRERLPYRTIGTIADEGLSGPADLRYYAGITPTAFKHVNSFHADHWGTDGMGMGQQGQDGSIDPGLLLLVIIGCVILLLPVVVFIATAARFGGERRDRRLAALRLVGADSHMTRRIAAGESLSGSVLGLVVGGALYLLLRELTSTVTLWGASFFVPDLWPSAPLAAVIAVAVPASAVVVTLSALRKIAIEPLGVVRNATPRRRRLWWRLALPALGLALLLPLSDGFRPGSSGGDPAVYQAPAGAVLLLVGTTAVLPWLVEAVVERFGKGPVPWQLATRRLQLSSGTAARAVSGITVAVAGAIAIQMLFASVEDGYTKTTGQDPHRAQMTSTLLVDNGAQAHDAFERYRHTKGVRGVIGITSGPVADAHSKETRQNVPRDTVTVGDCATLREVARVDSCKDGDVFVSKRPEHHSPRSFFTEPGDTVNLNMADDGAPASGEPKLWTVPKSARVVGLKTDPMGGERTGILATPGAFDVSALHHPEAEAMLQVDPKVPDAVEYARNTSATLSPSMGLMKLSSTLESNEFASIRSGLFIGATATMLMIGASMIVSTLEQLRERKRLLSVLVAFGTRRSTLSWSVLWQTAVPVVLGLAVSIAGGLTLGVMLVKMVGQPLAVDWAGLGTMTGIGGGVILLVTLVSLPPLWRMMRPEGLRTE